MHTFPIRPSLADILPDLTLLTRSSLARVSRYGGSSACFQAGYKSRVSRHAQSVPCLLVTFLTARA